MIKKYILLILFFLFVIFNNVYSASLITSTDINVLYVNVFHNGSWSGWQNKVDVYRGDKVWFQIHAYANGADIEGLVSKLDNIDGDNFDSKSDHDIYAFVDSDNTDRIYGSVNLNFKNDVKLIYSTYKWAIKLKGAFPEENEHLQKIPFGQSVKKTFTENGVSLGSLAEDYRSNLLLSFNTGKYEKYILGECGNEKNKCSGGDFIDKKDSIEEYKWTCKGSDNIAVCNLLKKPQNAQCSGSKNRCIKGVFNDIQDTSVEFLWLCKGVNGGEDDYCKKIKTPIDAVCGSKLNKCKVGKFVDSKDSYEYKLWGCKGLYSGDDKTCKIQKMCPCVKNKCDEGVSISDTDEANDIQEGNDLLIQCQKDKEKLLKIKNNLEKKNKENTVPKNNMNWFWIITLILVLLTFILTKKIYTD